VIHDVVRKELHHRRDNARKPLHHFSYAVRMRTAFG
jgi:hypothetical protein